MAHTTYTSNVQENISAIKSNGPKFKFKTYSKRRDVFVRVFACHAKWTINSQLNLFLFLRPPPQFFFVFHCLGEHFARFAVAKNIAQFWQIFNSISMNGTCIMSACIWCYPPVSLDAVYTCSMVVHEQHYSILLFTCIDENIRENKQIWNTSLHTMFLFC